MTSAIDIDALERALTVARGNPKHRGWIEERLANGEDWQSVAISCVFELQRDTLDLMPWQAGQARGPRSRRKRLQKRIHR